MVKHGFAIFESEWWHFDDADWQQCEALDLRSALQRLTADEEAELDRHRKAKQPRIRQRSAR